MLTIELRDQAERRLAQFAIFPMPSASAMPQELFNNFKYISLATGERYFFLVALDEIRGWKIHRDSAQQPSFKQSTIDVLGRYAPNPEAVTNAGQHYLAELVQAWLADLVSGWKSHGPAPAEAEMAKIGLLDELRAAAGSLPV